MSSLFNVVLIPVVFLCSYCLGTQNENGLDQQILDEILDLEATVLAQQEIIVKLRDNYTQQSSELTSLTREITLLKDKDSVVTETPEQELQTNAEDVDDLDKTLYLHKVSKDWNTRFERASSNKTLQNQPVAFYALFQRFTSQRVSAGDIISFNDVHLNLMNGYDATRNVFVTPISGVYLFSFSVECFANTLCKAALSKNGQRLAVAYSDAIDYSNIDNTVMYDQGAVSITLSLTKGDEVWVRAFDEVNQLLSGDRSTAFTGVMLWPLE